MCTEPSSKCYRIRFPFSLNSLQMLSLSVSFDSISLEYDIVFHLYFFGNPYTGSSIYRVIVSCPFLFIIRLCLGPWLRWKFEHVFAIRHHHRSLYVCEVFFYLYLQVLQMDLNEVSKLTKILCKHQWGHFLVLGKLQKSILCYFTRITKKGSFTQY